MDEKAKKKKRTERVNSRNREWGDIRQETAGFLYNPSILLDFSNV